MKQSSGIARVSAVDEEVADSIAGRRRLYTSLSDVIDRTWSTDKPDARRGITQPATSPAALTPAIINAPKFNTGLYVTGANYPSILR